MADQAMARQMRGPAACPGPFQIQVGEGRERSGGEDYEGDAHRAASSASARSNRPS